MRPPAASLPALGTDALFAVVLGAVMVVGSFGAQHAAAPTARPLDAAAWVLVGLAAVAALGRRLRPLAALALATAACGVYIAFGYPHGPIFFAFVVCAYTVAAHHPVRVAATAAVLAGAALAAAHGVAFRGDHLWAQLPLWVVWGMGFVLAPWAVGVAVRTYRDSRARARQERQRRHADAERLLIAQEVHDIVGHGLAVMNMQAAVALHVFDRSPEKARDALQAIKYTSKDSLEELRGTLAVFRGETGDAAPRAPEPGLAQLDALIVNASAGGLSVELRRTGPQTGVPAAVDLAAYRIVQESLTNVLRHAHATRASVHIAYAATELEVDISDDGSNPPVTDPDGHGITGMRTRAAAVGGTLQAGPLPDGGFRVRARLPLEVRE